MSKDYYVYAHYDREGRQFYLGKGKDKRAWSTMNRSNCWWGNVLNNDVVCFEVEILRKDMTEDEAYDFERSCIEEYGIEALANHQRGRKKKITI